ncbi:MAG TPA: hypothetical protein VNG33_00645 [Polyangiaceae bacterium]|nr:hypothetical protein [Polyangiaceae bacterium]
MTEGPSDSGVPLRVVVGLGLAASLLARCLSPALRGVAGDSAIIWSSRAASLLTLLAATGLVAGIARLATAVVGSPRAPLLARLVVVPAVSLGCMLLLFASFRPLEPFLALVLGISAAVVGSLSARHSVVDKNKRAAALVLGLTASAGLVHVLARKLTQDASDAANLAQFRTAQWIESLGLGLDLLALALALTWLQRRLARGRLVVPLVLTAAALCVVLSRSGSTPGANAMSMLLGSALKELGRDQASLLPVTFSHLLSIGSLLTAWVALFGGAGELGLVLAACLAARSSLDIPIPALMLELGALYLPFARTTAAGPTPAAPQAGSPLPDTSPP